MEKEEIVIEERVTIDEYAIVPITRISIHCQKNKEGNIFIGIKHPLAVLVTIGSKKVIHMITDDVSMEKLIEKLPELKNNL
jgi:ribosomal protein L7Ae-like RNA K-turn-binding protein